jgi:GT2 family glycosyltransferase
VVAHPDTVRRVLRSFDDPTLDAVIGSYDDEPHHPQFLSQYRNLMHCYYHRTGNPRASTFWCGCGAVRRSAVDAVGGFDVDSRWHYIEDIEFGYRLVAAAKRIALDPAIQVKHRKRWTFTGILRTDILYRGIPWTDLILRDRKAPQDLNTGPGQRVSVAAAGGLGLATLAGAWWAAAAALALILVINRGIFQFFARKRGWWFALRTIPMFVLYLGYSGLSFVLGAARNISRRSPNRPDSTQRSG